MLVLMEVERRLLAVTAELLSGFRAIVINGPRQSGKSTLVAQLQRARGPVVNLDDPLTLEVATADPVGFLQSLPAQVAIDEFQRGGNNLLLALKMALDSSANRGQFILAGSTRFLSTRTLSETLTGRIGIVELLPLSAGELRGTQEQFLDRAFGGALLDTQAMPLTRADYAQAVATGGFPELALGPSSNRFRTAWCDSYLRTVTAVANVEQVAEVRRPELFPGLVTQLAARSSAELVIADLARELGSNPNLVGSYLEVLRTLYLIHLLPAWTTSRTNRAKRRPVGHFVDTALATHLLGETDTTLSRLDSRWFGPLLESYVVGEVAKQASWADYPTTLGHYRDRDQREVDLIVERSNDIVAIEVKATATPVLSHARHLAFLRDRAGARFRCGILLHTGRQQLVLGDRLVATPISSLWS
jgi:uncharacterized protein